MNTNGLFQLMILVSVLSIQGCMFEQSDQQSSQKESEMHSLVNLESEFDRYVSELADSPEKIDEYVDRYVFEGKQRFGGFIEQSLQSKFRQQMSERALAIVRDPVLKTRLSESSNNDFPPHERVRKICGFFGWHTPVPDELLPIIVPYTESLEKNVRATVLMTIAQTGSKAQLTHMISGLKDPERDVRSWTLTGIKTAIRYQRLDPQIKPDLFDLLDSSWDRSEKFSISDPIPSALLQLDRSRAIGRLMQADVFNVDSPVFSSLLETLLKEDVTVPRDRLLALLDVAKKKRMEYPMPSILNSALPLLAMHAHPDDLIVFESLLKHEDDMIVSGAVDAIYVFHKHDQTIRNAADTVNSLGWENVTQVERHLVAIRKVEYEVDNGGFDQYFTNSSGDHWQDALTGLKAVGATRRAKIFQTVVDRFGKQGPSPDRAIRYEQLMQVSESQESVFSSEESVWYNIKDEPLNVLMMKYDFANLEGRQKQE